jgi:hypothetical protein
MPKILYLIKKLILIKHLRKLETNFTPRDSRPRGVQGLHVHVNRVEWTPRSPHPRGVARVWKLLVCDNRSLTEGRVF